MRSLCRRAALALLFVFCLAAFAQNPDPGPAAYQKWSQLYKQVMLNQH